MWDPRFPQVAVGSLPRGETPQNHRDRTNANVLLHSSLLSKLSDHLLLRLNHLYNRKRANGRRRFGAHRRTHMDEGTLILQNSSSRRFLTAGGTPKTQQDKPVASTDNEANTTVRSLRWSRCFPHIGVLHLLSTSPKSSLSPSDHSQACPLPAFRHRQWLQRCTLTGLCAQGREAHRPWRRRAHS